jgi:SAM-dependent methyltransferase
VATPPPSAPDGTSTYIIRGGDFGAARLRILGAATRPSTLQLLERAGVTRGMRVLDVGCGSGEVTVELARLVGPEGLVTAIDADPVVLDHARTRVADAGLRATFVCSDVMQPYPDEVPRDHDVGYARFLLTHVAAPETALAHLCDATRAGGTVIIEDVDIPGHFCHPPSAAFARYVELYLAVARRRGGDPAIGPRLPALLRAAGVRDVQVAVAQPVFLDGDGKRVAQLTLAGIRDAAIAAGLADGAEIDALVEQLDVERRTPGTLQSITRIVQAWGVR